MLHNYDWRVVNGQTVYLLQVNSLKFSPDGKLLAVTGYEVLRVYDVHSTSPLTTMSNNSDSNSKNITCVSFTRMDPFSLITGQRMQLHALDIRY